MNPMRSGSKGGHSTFQGKVECPTLLARNCEAEVLTPGYRIRRRNDRVRPSGNGPPNPLAPVVKGGGVRHPPIEV
jgi:hypothetical protein